MADAEAEIALVKQLGQRDGAKPEFLGAAIALIKKRYPEDPAWQRCWNCKHTQLEAAFGMRNNIGGPHDVHRDLNFSCTACGSVMSYIV